MIKQAAALLLAMAFLLALAGCGGTPAYRDGVYTAQSEDYSDEWRDVVTITVSGGKITAVDWNAYNQEGDDKKTLSKNGEYSMTVAGAKSEWFEQALSMESALVREQDPARIKVKSDGKTDAVSGVSISVSEFIRLAQQALEEAK